MSRLRSVDTATARSHLKIEKGDNGVFWVRALVVLILVEAQAILLANIRRGRFEGFPRTIDAQVKPVAKEGDRRKNGQPKKDIIS